MPAGHYLGVDLAWNDKRRTGLAVLDGSGALVESTSVITDGDLSAWICRWPDLRVIGIDAPVIVPNELGSRECEKAIGRAFGRYDAGAYPSNRTNPLFDPPRALLLAEHFGWHLDPGSTRRPLALEVYPHAGMVGLFRLGRVLPYKARPTRSVEDRKRAFRRLCDLLEGLAALRLRESGRWSELRRAVEEAQRPFHLARVEDEIDAIFCAHLVWLWDHRPGTLQVYGDPVAGLIVAPPPPTHPPSPRRS
jgi:predicted RNase H-like nuclease